MPILLGGCTIQFPKREIWERKPSSVFQGPWLWGSRVSVYHWGPKRQERLVISTGELLLLKGKNCETGKLEGRALLPASGPLLSPGSERSSVGWRVLTWGTFGDDLFPRFQLQCTSSASELCCCFCNMKLCFLSRLGPA